MTTCDSWRLQEVRAWNRLAYALFAGHLDFDAAKTPTGRPARNTVYVLSAAYLTGKDPNLVVAHLGH